MSLPGTSPHMEWHDGSAPVGNPSVTVRPDRRLTLLAIAKFAGVGAMIGVIVGVGMTLDGETKWSLLLAPLTFAAGGAGTLGCFMALTWWAFPGQVTYIVADGFLVARRGSWVRQRIAVDRIAEMEFDEDIDGIDLALTGWFGYTSPIPGLVVTLTVTPDRWDVTNSAAVFLPRILISGERQQRALRDLRAAVNLPTA